MNYKRLIHIIPFLLSFGCYLFFPNLWVMGLIFVYWLWSSTRVFKHDRSELKAASYYIRVKRKKFNIKDLFVLILFVTGGFLIWWCFRQDLENRTGARLIYLLTMGSYYFRTYYRNFQDAVKSFPRGIKIPEYPDKLILWSEIQNLTIDTNTLKMETALLPSYSFSFDSRDQQDAEQISNQFLINA